MGKIIIIDQLRCAIEKLEKLDQCDPEWDKAAVSMYNAMSSSHQEALGQLVRTGPVEDGDVISKACRDDLLDWGLASRVVVKNQQGYTAANYMGWSVLRHGESGNL